MLTYLEAWTMFLSLVLQKMCGTEATPSKLHRWWHGLTTPTGSAQKPICTPHNLWQWFRSKESVLFACLIKRVSKLPLYQLVIILSSADVLCKQFGRPPVKYFTDRPKAVLLLWIFYVFSVFRLLCLCARLFMCALFVFVALRPKSTAMVIAGRSVRLTTLFPGQAWKSG